MEQETLGQPKSTETGLKERIEAGIEDIGHSLRDIAQKGLDSKLLAKVQEEAYGVLGEVRGALERFHPKRVQVILTEGLSQKGRIPGELAGRTAETIVGLVSPENEGKPIGKEEERKFLSIFESIGGKRLRTAVVSLITSERGSVSLGGEEPPLEEEPPPSFGLPSVPQEYKAVPWWQKPMTRRTAISVLLVGGTAAVGVGVKPVRDLIVGGIVGLAKKIFAEAPRTAGEMVEEVKIKKEPGGEVKVMTQDIGEALSGEGWGKEWKKRRDKYQEMFDASRGKEEMPVDQFVNMLKHNMSGDEEYKVVRINVSAMYEVMKGYGSLEEIHKMLGENNYSPEEIGEWEKFYQAADQTDVGKKESFKPIFDWVDEWVKTHSSSTP